MFRLNRFAAVSLVLIAATAGAEQSKEESSMKLVDKTLVVWTAPADLDQHGGSALTIDDRNGGFDGIIFGELSPRRWMAGSEYWSRSLKEQESVPAETSGPESLVQIAIVYAGRRVTVYRDGEFYSAHDVSEPRAFDESAIVMFGKRHIDQGGAERYRGRIEDARIYARALTAEEIAELQPNQRGVIEPYAWWSFEKGVTDVTGRFPQTLMMGGASVSNGALVLQGEDPIVLGLGPNAFHEKPADMELTLAGMVVGQRKLREVLLADHQRPAYHFVAPEGACVPFDANGAIFWQGRYHLFYIFQDERGHCWGHVSSADLLHWRWHTTALFPGPGDPDRGIFSGNCFVNKQGEATILYHGVHAGNCIAICAEPGLDHWHKLPSNPIVPNPAPDSPESKLYSSWDPHGWLEGDTYYAIFGGGIPSVFKATELDDWKYVGPLMAPASPDGLRGETDVETGEDLSCPDLFTLGDKQVLMGISHAKGARYYIGEWRDEQFHPEYHAHMNWPGGFCFAPETLLDPKGRRIMWAWVMDRANQTPMHEGWSGVMTLPRVLSLGGDGMMRIEPIEELKKLRTNPRQYKDVELEDGVPVQLNDLAGDQMEIALTIRPGAARRVGLKVRCAPDGSEQTSIFIDRDSATLQVDFKESRADHSFEYYAKCLTPHDQNYTVTEQVAPFELSGDEDLHLRVFLDHSIVEVYANGRQCVTQRIYPIGEESLGIGLFSVGGDAVITDLSAWDMSPTVHW